MKIRSRQRKEEIESAQSSHKQIDLQVQELQNIQVELAQIEARRKFAIDSAKQSDLELQSIHNQIYQYSAAKRQLELQILTLQSQSNSLQSDIADKEVDRTQIRQQISSDEDRQNRLSITVDDLDRSIQCGQDLLQKLDRDLRRQTNLLSEVQTRKALAIDSVRQSDLELKGIREETTQQSAKKEQLKARVADLQNQLRSLLSEISDREIYHIGIEQQITRLEDKRNQLLTEIDGLDRSIQDKQALLDDLYLDLSIKTEIDLKIASLQQQKQEHQVSLDELEIVLGSARDSISELNTTFTSKQGQLDRIVNELTEIEARRQSAIDSAEQLGLASQRIKARIIKYSTIRRKMRLGVAEMQAQSSSLQTQISKAEASRTEIQGQIVRLKEELSHNISSLEDRDLIQNTIIEPLISWEDHFQNDPYLRILRHINQHGVITESEIRNILEDRYVANQFPRKIAEYNKNKYLPFKIEGGGSDSSGSRYLKQSKEDECLARLSLVDTTPPDSSQIEIVESQLDLTKTEKDIFELEEIPTPDLIYDDLQLDDEDPTSDLVNRYNQENWEDYFQGDPLLPILRHINEHGRILREQVYQMLRILGLNNQFSENIDEYNANNILPFFILTEEYSNDNCIYIKGIRNADL
ncbi:MAG: hypothetical protein LH474_04625 [Chamaesiphon sp.]|nr:hypothetical protein [Chamaesiphon sp.]